MEVRVLTDVGVERRPVEDLEGLLAGSEGFVWVDVPGCDEAAVHILSKTFGFHPRAVRDCVERNRVPKIQIYSDYFFVVLHTPELGKGGHVHYIELDQFVGPRYVVTVHGPVNPAVDPAVALRQTGKVLARIDAGRVHPASPFELSYSIVSALTRYLEEFVETLTSDVWRLEQRVTGGHIGDPEELLDELFQARHGLLAVRTMGVLSRDVYGRLAAFTRVVPQPAEPLVADVVDQFDRVRSLADGQREYLQGVIEFYRTRTETKMTIAAERLAVIAAVTLPIAALSSIMGMNLIVNERTQVIPLLATLAVMLGVSGALLRWAKHRGWW